MSRSVRKIIRPWQVVVALLFCSLWGAAHGEEILVAVASNFTRPMAVLADQFAEQSGHELQLAFGASGRLYAQIINGAPYQVFLSADQDKPAQLEAQGRIEPDSRFTFALGRLALWSNREGVQITGPGILRSDFERLALANPRLAPYGRAAEQVLESLGLLEATRGRWVQGENIAQTFQFVDTGNAGLGFVALSQLVGTDGLANAWQVDTALHEPIRQDAVLLDNAGNCQACREFILFMQSDQAREIIRSFGYDD